MHSILQQHTYVYKAIHARMHLRITELIVPAIASIIRLKLNSLKCNHCNTDTVPGCIIHYIIITS